MLPLRLCYLKQDGLFEDSHAESPLYKDWTDTVVSGFNLSLVQKPSLLSPTADEGQIIDECLQSIERNESDVSIMPFTMPIMMSNIKTGPVFFSNKIVIFSTYKVEKDDPNSHILDTFDAFGLDAVALIVNFCVILAALISFTYILERKGIRPRFTINGRRFNLRFIPWFMFSFFVNQTPFFPGNITALKGLLTCCLLTFSYFVTFFYSSMIKTDMVTVKPPRVIATYQDVLDDPEIKPYIQHLFDEYTSFKEAPKGSLKGKIWEKIVKMGVRKLVYNNEQTDVADDPDDPDKGKEFSDPDHSFMKSKAVIMAYACRCQVLKYFSALVFKKMKNREDRRGLFASDPTDSATLCTSVINRMTLGVASRKYEVRMRRFFEGHLWPKILDNAGLKFAQIYAKLLGLGNDISDVDEYVSQRVVLPEPEFVKPNITYFMPLFILYLVSCLIQLIIFLIERWVSHKE